MEDLDVLWQTVVEKVCKRCIDADPSGACLLRSDEACGLRMHFSAVVEAVRSRNSEELQPYLEALRANVCDSCSHQSAEGVCAIRNDLDCGLNRYFVLVVEAIEEADAAHRSGELLTGTD